MSLEAAAFAFVRCFGGGGVVVRGFGGGGVAPVLDDIRFGAGGGGFPVPPSFGEDFLLDILQASYSYRIKLIRGIQILSWVCSKVLVKK